LHMWVTHVANRQQTLHDYVRVVASAILTGAGTSTRTEIHMPHWC
jgi:hypothetical protein